MATDPLLVRKYYTSAMFPRVPPDSDIPLMRISVPAVSVTLATVLVLASASTLAAVPASGAGDTLSESNTNAITTAMETSGGTSRYTFRYAGKSAGMPAKYIETRVDGQNGDYQSSLTIKTAKGTTFEQYRFVTDTTERRCWTTTDGKVWRAISPTKADAVTTSDWGALTPLPERLAKNLSTYAGTVEPVNTVDGDWLVQTYKFPNGDEHTNRSLVTHTADGLTVKSVELFNGKPFLRGSAFIPKRPIALTAP